MRWPKYWSFSLSIIPAKKYPGLISFRMDWLDLFAVQRTLKSLLQHHSSKASNLRRSVFFTVQLSHPSMMSSVSSFQYHQYWLKLTARNFKARMTLDCLLSAFKCTEVRSLSTGGSTWVQVPAGPSLTMGSQCSRLDCLNL